jgi:ATP-binding cassette subfamily B protein
LLGGGWLLARVWYALAYARDPKTRGPAFALSMLCFAARSDWVAPGAFCAGWSAESRTRPQSRARRRPGCGRCALCCPTWRPIGKQVALALLLLLLAAAATLSLPFAVKLLVDGGLALPPGSELGERMLSIREHFLWLFAVAVGLGVATAGRYYMVSWIGERVTTDLRQAVYAHVLRQSPQFFETLKSGEVLSRLTTDTTVIHSAVGSSISMGLRNSVLFVGGLTMLVSTTPRLMLTVVGIIVLFVLPAVLIGRRVRKLSRASQDRIADTSGIAGEILNAISDRPELYPGGC